MVRPKFVVGEVVEMFCPHRVAGQLVTDWLAGTVVQADHRMLAVRFDRPVFSGSGLPIPDQILWCTHGSRNLRRPAPVATATAASEVNTHD